MFPSTKMTKAPHATMELAYEAKILPLANVSANGSLELLSHRPSGKSCRKDNDLNTT